MASFPVDNKALSDFVEAAKTAHKASEVQSNVIPQLQRWGEIPGLVQMLKGDPENGLRSSVVQQHKEHFGENRLPIIPPPTIWELMFELLKDPTLIVLICAAIVSLILGLVFECPETGWIEGFVILLAVVVVVVVGAVNDWKKNKQFQALNAIKDDIKIDVVRDGKQTQVSTYDVVVGDVVELKVGDILCADGVFLRGNGLSVNEAALTGESDDMKKGPYAFDGDKILHGPVLYGSTKVMEGEGRMLVIAVGLNSTEGILKQTIAETGESTSILQRKLNKMAQAIGNGGLIVSGIVLVVLLLRMGIEMGEEDISWDHSEHWGLLMRHVITAVTVLVVAVPEGLPLAVTISLAFSVKRMLEDQNLVRHLSSCETMGNATTICSDKTGTLTTNRMTVMRCWLPPNTDMPRADPWPQIAPAQAQLLGEAIALNSSARLEFPASGPPEHIGNKTECALLQFAHEIKQDYNAIRTPLKAVEPRIYTFSSARKRMSSLWPWAADGPQAMRLFMKGAPEIMLERCSHVYDAQSGEVPMTEELKRHLLDTVMNAYASDSLRTLCIAYRRFPQGVPDLDDVDGVETALVVLAVVGIEDPVRGEVPKAVQTCRDAGITVRMVTGDNIVTARSIARKCGLCLPGEAPGTEFLAMEGPVFRQQVLKTNKETGEEEIDQAKIDTIWPRLLVLARSSPKDKHTLVTAIMDSTALEMRQVVAVTGDGTNDAPALKKAHVGFAMGITGTSVAKDAADIIVMDDNFSSIVQAVKWGRCVYDNICKFLQFQLTVNLAAIAIAVVGACAIQESPLKAIHLLWVNMIMDSLASLALATEAPTDGLLQRKPYSRDKALLSPVMMRNMVCNSVYQFIVILWCIWGLPDALDLECGTQECLKDSREGKSEVDHCESDATTHFTMLFNIFVLMQLFNELNCRKINNERNVFVGSLANPWFVSIMAATSILQILAVEFGGEFFGTVGLHIREWAICMVFGVFELVLYPLITLVPPSLFEPLSNFFGGAGIPPEEDEDEGAEGADPVVGQEMAERRSEAAAAQAPYLKPSGGMFASAMPPPPPQGGGVGETVANIDDGNVTPTPPDPPGSVWGAPQVQQPTSAFQPPQQFQPQVFQPQAAYPYTNQL